MKLRGGRSRTTVLLSPAGESGLQRRSKASWEAGRGARRGVVPRVLRPGRLSRPPAPLPRHFGPDRPHLRLGHAADKGLYPRDRAPDRLPDLHPPRQALHLPALRRRGLPRQPLLGRLRRLGEPLRVPGFPPPPLWQTARSEPRPSRRGLGIGRRLLRGGLEPLVTGRRGRGLYPQRPPRRRHATRPPRLAGDREREAALPRGVPRRARDDRTHDQRPPPPHHPRLRATRETGDTKEARRPCQDGRRLPRGARPVPVPPLARRHGPGNELRRRLNVSGLLRLDLRRPLQGPDARLRT